MNDPKIAKQAQLHPFTSILRGERASDLRGLTVGLDDAGTARVVARHLRSLSAEEVDALAATLKEMARHLRDGWRGDKAPLLH